MGNIFFGKSLFGEPTMVIDRIICTEPYLVNIGVCGIVGKEDNPYKKQVIRVNNGQLKSLVNYTVTSNSIIYDFEDNIKLQFTKRENDIVYHIKTNDIEHTSIVPNILRNNYSKISLASEELDKIADFFNH